MFKIDFDTQNADFQYSGGVGVGPAVSAVLRKLADYLEELETEGTKLEDGGVVRDLNGNSIGTWMIQHSNR